MEPNEDAFRTPLKGGNMILNRFCIDEDAAFELSGVNSLEKTLSDNVMTKWYETKPELYKAREIEKIKLKMEEKGKEYSF